MTYRLSLLLILCSTLIGCDFPSPRAVSTSGVTKATVKMPKRKDGLTSEQYNIQQRVKIDNDPGSVKHLYIQSPFTGQCLFYSTVRGKVTSSGKRLTPYTVIAGINTFSGNTYDGFAVDFGNRRVYTAEVMQDDGTYGSSNKYIYWFDIRGQFHKRLKSEMEAIHISDRPIRFREIIVDIEKEALGRKQKSAYKD